MKYIDAEKMKAEIRKRINELDRDKYISVDNKTTRIAELHFIDRCIDSLQQEQPEVDLEKDAVSYCYDNGINISPRQAKGIARHFWNKGYIAGKEE